MDSFDTSFRSVKGYLSVYWCYDLYAVALTLKKSREIVVNAELSVSLLK